VQPLSLGDPEGEAIAGWSRDQVSEIGIPVRFHNMAQDVFPDREGVVIRLEGEGDPPASQAAPSVSPLRGDPPPPPSAVED